MWSIIKSHFHKGKVGYIITSLFVILSVLMMIVGVSICLGINDMYLNARNLSNSPDISLYVKESVGGPASQRVIDNLTQREDIETLDIQPYYKLEMPESDNGYVCNFIFSDNSVMAMKSIGFYNIDDSNNKFKPYVRNQIEGEGFKFYVSGNYLITGHIGDRVFFRYNGEEYLGYVAGVFDDMCKLYSAQYFYVDNDFFSLLTKYSQEDSQNYIMLQQAINIRLSCNDEVQSKNAQNEIATTFIDILNEYNKQNIGVENQVIVDGNSGIRQVFKDATSPFILILGAAMIAFAVIVAVIVAIVIAFLVRSSVMDEVRNLGVLKSLGYTTNMLRLSYLAIYGIIALACMLVGIVLGITLMPTFVNIITNMARLDMSRAVSLNVGGVFIAIALIIFVIGGVVMLATGKVKRVTPLSAMRNNVETHNFKRNLIPLSKSKVHLNVTLGAKSAVGEVNRSIMVIAVVLIMSLLTSFISVIYYNLKVDQTAIIQMSAIECPDYVIGLRYDDTKPYFDALRGMDSYEYDMLAYDASCYIDGQWQRGQYYENFEILRTKILYKGRYPKYSNELILNEKYAKEKGYEIGDTITLNLHEYSLDTINKECVIVGYYQSVFENCNYMAYYDLVKEYIKIDTNNWQRFFYFKQGQTPSIEDIKAVLKTVNNESEINFGGFVTGRARLENMILNTVESTAEAVMTVFMSITAIIISLLLIMLIRLKILRERRNYAVYKALGYTTTNIMTQIAITMVILGVIGSVVGSIVGALLTSPILSLVGGMIGVGHFAFVIPWGFVVAILFGVPILIYLVSMLCAVPVRKITPAKSLRERG